MWCGLTRSNKYASKRLPFLTLVPRGDGRALRFPEQVGSEIKLVFTARGRLGMGLSLTGLLASLIILARYGSIRRRLKKYMVWNVHKQWQVAHGMVELGYNEWEEVEGSGSEDDFEFDSLIEKIEKEKME